MSSMFGTNQRLRLSQLQIMTPGFPPLQVTILWDAFTLARFNSFYLPSRLCIYLYFEVTVFEWVHFIFCQNVLFHVPFPVCCYLWISSVATVLNSKSIINMWHRQRLVLCWSMLRFIREMHSLTALIFSQRCLKSLSGSFLFCWYKWAITKLIFFWNQAFLGTVLYSLYVLPSYNPS